MTEIFTGRAVSPARSEQMQTLLRRDFSQPGDADHQAHEFTAPGLPSDAKLWSKAGYMSTHRHDAACVELANGVRFILVAFTANHAKEQGIIPAIARVVTEGMGKSKFRNSKSS
jgi:hypothetical protein